MEGGVEEEHNGCENPLLKTISNDEAGNLPVPSP